MADTINQMQNWIKQYYPDIIYVCLIIVAAIYLFVCKKEHRKSLICPIIVILICILNPIIYQKLLSRMVYWRMFWMIPDAILISYAITDIIKKCKPVWIKSLLIIAGICGIIITGVRVYNEELFVRTQNLQKVSANTEKVCDTILAIDKNPKCIIPDGMYCEARQYNGDIELMYGRNAEGYINELSERYMLVHFFMQQDEPDYEYIFSVAKEDGYDFIACQKKKAVPDEILEKFGYDGCADAGEYWVYYSE